MQLNAAEIKSSFYRPHRASTYARWAAAAPADFRFAIKIPKSITHEHRLRGCDALLEQFMTEIASLGDRLAHFSCGCHPASPSMKKWPTASSPVLAGMRAANIVCEPRHPSWFTHDVDAFLAERGIARVASDPPVCAAASSPGGWRTLDYTRMHGSPRVYWSSFTREALRARAFELRYGKPGIERWLIFDNTAAGAALADVAAMITDRDLPLRRGPG